MALKVESRTTFEPSNVIQPIYTGGSVALGPDGRVLATSLGEDVLLTDLRTGKQLLRIEGDGENITTFSLAPDCLHLVVCSRSLSMRIYTLSGTKDNTRAEILRTLKPHAAPVVTSSIDRTGTLLATGGADGVTKVWDIRGGFATHTFHGHGGLITALHFFEVSTSEPETTPRHRKGKSKNKQDGAIGLSTAEGEATLGFRLATGHEDGKIRIWDLHKRKSIVVLDLHVSVVRSLEYSEHKDALLSGSRDKTVMLWDGRTWKNRSTIPILESVESAGFLKDGQLIYTGGENGRLRLWQTKNGMEVTQEQQAGAETESIVEVLYLKSSPFLFSVHADQTFALHSLTPIDSA
ncbi:U3 small nucleolar RNA-associated protein 13, partial [Cryomyces antarcticus]